MTAIKAPVDDTLLTLADVARLCGRTPRWVQALAKEGFITKSERGKYRLSAVMTGITQHFEVTAQKASKTMSASRVQDARAKEIERRLAREERDLISQDEALLAMSMLVGKVAQELAGMGARITRDMALRRQIEAEVHGAQTRIAAALEKLSGFVATGGEPPETLT